MINNYINDSFLLNSARNVSGNCDLPVAGNVRPMLELKGYRYISQPMPAEVM